MIDQEGKLHGFMYRFVLENYKEQEWKFALTEAETETQLIGIRCSDPAWTVDITPVVLTEDILGKLSGMYLGSRKSGKKSVSSRENGKKGGRPRKNKPISQVENESLDSNGSEV